MRSRRPICTHPSAVKEALCGRLAREGMHFGEKNALPAVRCPTIDPSRILLPHIAKSEIVMTFNRLSHILRRLRRRNDMSFDPEFGRVVPGVKGFSR